MYLFNIVSGGVFSVKRNFSVNVMVATPYWWLSTLSTLGFIPKNSNYFTFYLGLNIVENLRSDWTVFVVRFSFIKCQNSYLMVNFKSIIFFSTVWRIVCKHNICCWLLFPIERFKENDAKRAWRRKIVFLLNHFLCRYFFIKCDFIKYDFILNL